METTRRYARDMEGAFGPGHRSSYGLQPMREPRPYSPAWCWAMALVSVAAIVAIYLTR